MLTSPQGGPPASTARRCPVCDADRPAPLFDNRMAPIADIDFSYTVVECEACGMVYASHAPDDATNERYYRQFSKYDHPRSVADVGAADIDRAAVAAAFTRRVLPPGARLLDVGCAIGLYLSTLARSGGFDVRGLDPSPASADVAKRLFGVAVDVGDAYGFDDYDAFDGIALLAVLEHLRDPARLFETLARRMKPGATLIVEVPDADAFGEHPAIGRVSEPFGEFSNEHINFFGDASLRRLAENAGLAWVASEPFPYLIGIRGLIAAFRKDGRRPTADTVPRSRESVVRYVDASSAAIADVETRLIDAGVADRPVVLYGAGSHSARLLAQGSLGHATIDAVLDRNPHLTGRTIGGLRIALPQTLADLPGRPVVVSSFYAMSAIVDHLRSHFDNEIVALYPETGAVVSAPPRARAALQSGQRR